MKDHFAPKLFVWLTATTLAISSAQGATVTYTMQTGNFNANQSSGSGFKGFFDNGASEIGVYANSAGDASFAAFQTFTTTGVGSGTARALQVGDTFTLTGYIVSSPPSRIGLALRSSTAYTSFGSIDANNEAKLQLESAGGWKIYNGGTTLDSGNGAGADSVFTIKVTSSNTFNATVVRSGNTYNAYDLPMTTQGGGISSFGVFAVNSANDTFWKNGAVTDTGTVEFGSGNGTSTVTGLVQDGLAANSTSTARANALTKNGSGTITLTATNTYTGGTTIASGTLKLGAGGSSGSAGSGSINLASGATLLIDRSDSPVFTNSVNLSGASGHPNLAAATGRTATFSGPITTSGAEFWTGSLGSDGKIILGNAANSFTASVVIQSGTLEADTLSNGGSNSALGKGGIFIGQGGSGTLRYTGVSATTDRIGAFALQGTSNSSTVDVASASANLTISSAVGGLTGANGLTKSGPGTLTLSGTATFTGGANVSQGALIINGSTAAGSAVTVASGATIGGTGTINGTLAVNSGATLAPGTNGIGTLTAANTVTLSGTILAEINRAASPNADKLNRTGGSLAFGGTLTVTNIGAAPQNGDTFDLFDATSFTGAFSAINLPPGGTTHWKTANLSTTGIISFTNTAPVAKNVTTGTAKGNTITLPIIGAKHAPTDADGDTLTVTAVGTATSGTSGFTSTSVTYDATSATLGTNTFTYTVSDGFGGTDTKTVTVIVTAAGSGANIISLTGTVPNITINFAGLPGSTYAVDRSTNLTSWVQLTTGATTGTNGLGSYTDNSAPLSSAYYRTRFLSTP